MAFNSTYLAPNGKPSNLTPEQYRLVRSPEFKAWFGDWENSPETASKFIDDNGEPKVAIHYTNKLQLDEGGDDDGYETKFDASSWSRDRGNYFYKTPNTKINPTWFYTEIGSAFSKSVKDDGDRWSIPFFINVKKLFDTCDYSDLKKLEKYAVKTYGTTGHTPIVRDAKTGKILSGTSETQTNFSGLADEVNCNEYLSIEVGWSFSGQNEETSGSIPPLIKEMGYDGYIIKDEGGTMAVFDKGNYKIADGSNTTFDGNNPDIRFDEGGNIDDENIVKVSNYILERHPKKNDILKGGKSNGFKVVKIERKVKPYGTFYSLWLYDTREDKLSKDKKRIVSYSPDTKRISDFQKIERGSTKGTMYMIWNDSSIESKMESGGRTISQTPSPKKDRVYGSQVNPKKSSSNLSSALKIEFSAETTKTIKNKVEKHNSEHPNKQITVESAKAVVRRGMGAYSNSHRPTISGGKPNSRFAWGLARLNAFIYKILNGKSKSGKYKQDDDLISELGYKVSRFDNGGKTDIPTRFFGSQGGGVLIYCKPTNRVLLLLRSPFVLEPFTWGTISGKVEGNEQIEETVKREAYEETGFKLKTLYPSYVFERPNFKFFNFISIVEQEFEPQLDWENIDYLWTSLDNMPDNMHFGLAELLKHGKIQETVKQLTSRFKKGG